MSNQPSETRCRLTDPRRFLAEPDVIALRLITEDGHREALALAGHSVCTLAIQDIAHLVEACRSSVWTPPKRRTMPRGRGVTSRRCRPSAGRTLRFRNLSTYQDFREVPNAST